jgi:hypothetical protein
MYKAIVAKIETSPLPGSDNIVLGRVSGYHVLVSKDTVSGTIGIFFEAGGQLSEEFCKEHDLVRRKNEDGTSAGGYFDPSRRVRAVKMRGMISEGFFCELDKLVFTGARLSDYKEGDQFDVVNGVPICNKYYTPRTRNAMQQNSEKVAKRENRMFAKHIDTEAFKRGVGLIPSDSLIIVTEKEHGTSHRIGCVLEETPIKRHKLAAWWAKLWKLPTHTKAWITVHGSRNVVLSDEKPGFYGSNAFRYRAVGSLALRKGEVVYGEIVGYTEGDSPVMNRQDLSGLKDKALEKVFGKVVTYSYGCEPGQAEFHVYRITQVNEDGYVTELSFFDMEKRCEELGVKSVKVLDRFIYDGNESGLSARIEDLAEGGEPCSVLDSRHIKEGVVVRHESHYGVGWLKSKSRVFGILEGYLKDTDYIDTEEAA